MNRKSNVRTIPASDYFRTIKYILKGKFENDFASSRVLAVLQLKQILGMQGF